MLRSTLGAAAIALCLGAVRLGASEIRVPEDQPSILLALKAAATGDTILVAPGTWKVAEPIHFSGKSVALRGVEGPERTSVVFDPAPSDPPRGSVFIVEDGESEAQGPSDPVIGTSVLREDFHQ